MSANPARPMRADTRDESMNRTIQVAVRLPADLLERIDRYAEHLEEQTPGATFTRAEAMRVLLTSALDAAESAAKPKRQR